jgi:putative ABC transport system permease protein
LRPAGNQEIAQARPQGQIRDLVRASERGRTPCSERSPSLSQEAFDLGRIKEILNLLDGRPGARLQSFEIRLRPGTDAQAYATRLTRASGGEVGAGPTASSDTSVSLLLVQAVIAGLAIVLVTIAVAGVFTTVVLNTRERAREVAILKAVGMGPRQVVTMVVASVAALGLVAGLAGIPLGLTLHARVLSLMGEIAGGTGIPAVFSDVIPGWQLPALGLAGVAVAAAGAWLPARWAAAGGSAEVLQAE